MSSDKESGSGDREREFPPEELASEAARDSGIDDDFGGGPAAIEEPEAETAEDAGAVPEAPEPISPAPRLDRLQKILAQAGIASRRHAEELITQGRVQVNGQIVTTLGAKADPARDHIRVDGKPIHSAERHRYFILNKPKGYVTTASDPEGRPTVMQFFAKMPERLYPVGRLDYQSEGLLLVTNDGELAHKLTRAAAGVEKTYLVKVSGRPSEAELDLLRRGVAIDRSRPGAGKVETAPARIRQVRKGDNPWYEVVLTEGRNRELRKMFQEIGHFVEKIRRVGYGPLVLDLEPGKIRELDPQELANLRKAAEGKWRAPKPKEPPRREAGRGFPRREAGKGFPRREPGGYARRPGPRGPQEGRGEPALRGPQEGREKARPFRDKTSGGFGPRGPEERAGGAREWDRNKTGRPFRPSRETRPEQDSRGDRRFAGKPEWKRPDRDRGAAGRPAREERAGEERRPKRFAPGPGAKPGFRPRPEGYSTPETAAPGRSRPGGSRPGEFGSVRRGPGKPGPKRPGPARPGPKKFSSANSGRPADRRRSGPRPGGRRPGSPRSGPRRGRP